MQSILSCRKRSFCLGVLLAAGCAGGGAFAQSAPPTTTVPTMPGAPPALGNVNPDEQSGSMAEKMARERNAIRHKEIVDDTNRLLALAQQLKEAVDKSSKDELSLDVVKKAAEIEKLAKSVKNKMRAEAGEPIN